MTCEPLYSSGSSCFARETASACRLASDAVAPEAAYARCYEGAEPADASRVLLADLVAGDRVLTASQSGVLEATLVVVNQHARREGLELSELLTIETSDGSAVSLTPEHALFADGKLVAASAVRVGSALRGASGAPVGVVSISQAEGAIVNPVTAAGTLLVSDEGAPVLAASHPIWIAPLVLESALARALVHSGIAYVGDASSLAHGVGYGLCKLAATLAVVGLGFKTKALLKAKARSMRAKAKAT